MQRKLSRFGRKLAKLVPSFPKGAGKRAETPSRAASKSGTKGIPRLALLIPLLVAGAALAVFLRSCNSTQVVIEENEEMIRVRQMMNQVLEQQQQQSGP
ncbi:MAG: hypothetical protein KF886_25925 [Candidatus Hydrogenedentes bacterium]|nr:hypothetical protein [Candidatus Hydrogenedentota bacterium]